MNKNVFITGDTSEIGKSLIHKLAKNKCNIFFTYFKNLRESQSISKSLKQYNIHHNYAKMDLTKIVSINNACNKFSNDFKKYKKVKKPKELANFIYKRFIKIVKKTSQPIIFYD